jgi:hypothetical protein
MKMISIARAIKRQGFGGGRLPTRNKKVYFSLANRDRSTIEAGKSTILYLAFNPRISTNIEGLQIAYISPYSVELDRIDPEYDDYIVLVIFKKTYCILSLLPSTRTKCKLSLKVT